MDIKKKIKDTFNVDKINKIIQDRTKNDIHIDNEDKEFLYHVYYYYKTGDTNFIKTSVGIRMLNTIYYFSSIPIKHEQIPYIINDRLSNNLDINILYRKYNKKYQSNIKYDSLYRYFTKAIIFNNKDNIYNSITRFLNDMENETLVYEREVLENYIKDITLIQIAISKAAKYNKKLIDKIVSADSIYYRYTPYENINNNVDNKPIVIFYKNKDIMKDNIIDEYSVYDKYIKTIPSSVKLYKDNNYKYSTDPSYLLPVDLKLVTDDLYHNVYKSITHCNKSSKEEVLFNKIYQESHVDMYTIGALIK